MKRLIPLMQREWLQHRFGWLMMAVIPLALSVLLLTFGQIQFAPDEMGPDGKPVPALLAAASIGGSTAVMFIIATFSSLIIVSNLARRDHADRSVEFWLSVPAGHGESFAAPLIVHLLLVPAAAVLVGMASGYLISLVLVTRLAGVGAWFDLPWGILLSSSAVVSMRILAGLPLALLWLSPVVLLVVLLTALFRRWGWVILAVGFGVGSYVLKLLFGQPWLNRILSQILEGSARSIIHGEQGGMVVESSTQTVDVLKLLPAWAWDDFSASVGMLASPTLVGGLVVAGACFYGLTVWRSRGAGAAG